PRSGCRPRLPAADRVAHRDAGSSSLALPWASAMNPAMVVPVRGGDRLTGRNLAEIAAAASRSGARLFVVDNGMPEWLRAGLALPGTIILDCLAVGSYRARNVGIEAALGAGHDPVLFTDADCRPQVGWPEHLIELSRLAA